MLQSMRSQRVGHDWVTELTEALLSLDTQLPLNPMNKYIPFFA